MGNRMRSRRQSKRSKRGRGQHGDIASCAVAVDMRKWAAAWDDAWEAFDRSEYRGRFVELSRNTEPVPHVVVAWKVECVMDSLLVFAPHPDTGEVCCLSGFSATRVSNDQVMVGYMPTRPLALQGRVDVVVDAIFSDNIIRHHCASAKARNAGFTFANAF